jgi:hypothetical protein
MTWLPRLTFAEAAGLDQVKEMIKAKRKPTQQVNSRQ